MACAPWLRLLPWLLVPACAASHADTVRVAVAANFAGPAKELSAGFARESGHEAVLSVGSTGKFYAQIAAVRRSTCSSRPTSRRRRAWRRREWVSPAAASPMQSAGSSCGVLCPAWWTGAATCCEGARSSALPSPTRGSRPMAPPPGRHCRSWGLGSAAAEARARARTSRRRYQFVSTGNAELGFVAAAQMRTGGVPAGSHWVVPAALHDPMRQDAVLLTRAARQPGRASFPGVPAQPRRAAG